MHTTVKPVHDRPFLYVISTLEMSILEAIRKCGVQTARNPGVLIFEIIRPLEVISNNHLS